VGITACELTCLSSSASQQPPCQGITVMLHCINRLSMLLGWLGWTHLNEGLHHHVANSAACECWCACPVPCHGLSETYSCAWCGPGL